MNPVLKAKGTDVEGAQTTLTRGNSRLTRMEPAL